MDFQNGGLLSRVAGSPEQLMNAASREMACSKGLEELLKKYGCDLTMQPTLLPVTLPNGQVVFAVSGQIQLTARVKK
jgi:hypothetical protein